MAALAATALALTVPAGAARAKAPVRECGNLTSRLAWNITTRKVGCHRAKQVVRRWGDTAAKEGGDGEVLGLYCDYREAGFESGDIRCTGPRGRVVHWQTGS